MPWQVAHISHYGIPPTGSPEDALNWMSSSGAVKTFIYGSCVSRDTFEFLDANFDLIRYVARQSMVSAGTDARVLRPQLEQIDSAFQSRMVTGDLSGDLPSALATAAPELDLLLVDLVDERGGVIDVDGAYVTKLSEFWSSGGQRATRGMEHHPFGTDLHFALWQASAVRFVRQLVDLELVPKTVVLRTPWASRYDDGEPLEIPDWMLSPAEADC